MHLEDEDVDRRIRSAVEPGPEVIDRVVAAALASKPHPRTPILIAGMALLTAAVCLSVLFIRHQPPDAPITVFQIEYVGNLAVFEYPDGSTSIVTPESAGRGQQEHLNLILFEGDKP
jgi:hypothetical protein